LFSHFYPQSGKPVAPVSRDGLWSKNIDHQTDAGNSGVRCTLEQWLWVRLGAMQLLDLTRLLHRVINNGADHNTDPPHVVKI
jgi:hypothetical protein